MIDAPCRSLDRILHLHVTDNIQHLRRLVTAPFLPEHIRRRERRNLAVKCGVADHTSTDGALEQLSSTFAGQDVPIVSGHLLICLASTVGREELLSIVGKNVSTNQMLTTLDILSISVPLYAPTSAEQAAEWSRDYWPTVYRRNNPFGPHPSIVSHAQDKIRPFVRTWMESASSSALATAQVSKGEAFGAVVVDPTVSRNPSIIAAAGDARWKDQALGMHEGCGNVMAHSVMRVIGMVAAKRRSLEIQDFTPSVDLRAFVDQPITPVEEAAYLANNIAPGGYLCSGLEIYVTHEPCVMCSMAIVHSRFSKVIFGQRMPMTGGLFAEKGSSIDDGLGYGLFWLPELNWRLLAWQWKDEDQHRSFDNVNARLSC